MSDSEDDAAFASADEGEPEATAVSKSAPASESKTKDTKREKKVSEDNNDKTDSKSGNTSKSSVNEKKKETKTAVASKSKESVKSEVPPSKKQEEKSKGGKGKKKRGKQTKAETASQNSGGKPETNSAGDTEEKEVKSSPTEAAENLQKKDEPTIDSSEIERKLKISDSGKSTVSETISSDDKIIAPETKEAKESHSEEANLNVKSTVTEEKITTEVKRDKQLTSDKERKEISKGDQEAKAAFDRLSQPSKQKVVYNLLKYETQFKLYLCIYFP